jgi:hypothetical protein
MSNSTGAEINIRLPDIPHASAVNNPLLVIATADRFLTTFDLRNVKTHVDRIISPFDLQTRSVIFLPYVGLQC